MIYRSTVNKMHMMILVSSELVLLVVWAASAPDMERPICGVVYVATARRTGVQGTRPVLYAEEEERRTTT